MSAPAPRDMYSPLNAPRPDGSPKPGAWRATAPGASILTGIWFLGMCMRLPLARGRPTARLSAFVLAAFMQPSCSLHARRGDITSREARHPVWLVGLLQACDLFVGQHEVDSRDGVVEVMRLGRADDRRGDDRLRQ